MIRSRKGKKEGRKIREVKMEISNQEKRLKFKTTVNLKYKDLESFMG